MKKRISIIAIVAMLMISLIPASAMAKTTTKGTTETKVITGYVTVIPTGSQDVQKVWVQATVPADATDDVADLVAVNTLKFRVKDGWNPQASSEIEFYGAKTGFTGFNFKGEETDPGMMIRGTFYTDGGESWFPVTEQSVWAGIKNLTTADSWTDLVSGGYVSGEFTSFSFYQDGETWDDIVAENCGLRLDPIQHECDDEDVVYDEDKNAKVCSVCGHVVESYTEDAAVVKTADNNMLGLYVALFGMAALACAGMVIRKRNSAKN